MPMLDLEPAADEVIRLLGGVRDDHLDRPTPCAQTSVAALLDHLMGLSLAFTWAARKTPPVQDRGTVPGPGRATAEHLDPDWRAVLPVRLRELAAAWREQAAWTGLTEAGGIRMPAEQLGVVALDELVLHGWDLARASDQRFGCDPASTGAVLAFTTAAALPENAPRREGLFGPVVPVPDDAPGLDRALGLAGRDPAWSAASVGGR